MPPVHLLIKPASGSCNMRCAYCFYCEHTSHREGTSLGMMSLDCLEKVFAATLPLANGGCTISYQGGEPTLAGLEFFREAMALQKKYSHPGITVQNALQTNGLLITEEWVAFLKEENFLVGLSLDGDEALHDMHRVDSAGKGTFKRVAKAGKMLLEAGVAVNILAVLTAAGAKHPQKIYRDLTRLGFEHLQFIPCLDPLGNQRGLERYSLTPQAYGEFLCRLFDCWYEDFVAEKEISIRQFENYVGILAGIQPENCAMQGVCGRQMVVEADGSIYPCDFYVEAPFCLGNLTTDSWQQIEDKREEIGFIAASLAREACESCPYFTLCRGGCRRDREPLAQGNKNDLCSSYQAFFAHALPTLQRLGAFVCRERNSERQSEDGRQ